MKLVLLKEIFKKYPHTQIGYVVAKINVQKTSEYTENLKSTIRTHLKKMSLTDKTYDKHPHIIGWRKVFTDFEANPNYRASVDALLKRVVTGGKMWNISTVVDMYNICSVMSLMPMGGYDIKKIKGDIVLRYGKEGETVAPLGAEDTFPVTPKHVIYADNEKVLCWLWNYRDSRLSCIDNETQDAIFFIDSAFEQAVGSMQNGIDLLSNHLKNIGSVVACTGILNSTKPEIELDLNILNSMVPAKIATPMEFKGSVDSLEKKRKNVQESDNPPKVSKKAANPAETKSSSAFVLKQTYLTTKQLAKDIRFSENITASGTVNQLSEFFKENPNIRSYSDFFGNNLVHIAVRNERIENIIFLLDEVKIDINAKNSIGNTPLLLALQFKLKSVIPTLLKRNPDITCVNAEGETALSMAKKLGYKEFIADLIPAPLMKVENLIHAIKANDLSSVQKLVEAKADINVIDSNKHTPYMHAVQAGHMAIARFLVDRGAKRPHDPMGNVVVDEDLPLESNFALS